MCVPSFVWFKEIRHKHSPVGSIGQDVGPLLCLGFESFREYKQSRRNINSQGKKREGDRSYTHPKMSYTATIAVSEVLGPVTYTRLKPAYDIYDPCGS